MRVYCEKCGRGRIYNAEKNLYEPLQCICGFIIYVMDWDYTIDTYENCYS